MMLEKCEICRFWKLLPREFDGRGLCVRYPPIAVEGTIAVFPQSMPLAWCGEFQPKEASQ